MVRCRDNWIGAAVIAVAVLAPHGWGQTRPDDVASRPVGSSTRLGAGKSFEDGAVPRKNGSATGDWLRTAGAMAIVVALIFAVRFLLRRIGGPAAAHRRLGALEVLGRQNLSGRHQLYLVRLGGRLLLVGAGPEGLSTLAEVRDPQEFAQLIEAATGRDPAAGPGGADSLKSEPGKP